LLQQVLVNRDIDNHVVLMEAVMTKALACLAVLMIAAPAFAAPGSISARTISVRALPARTLTVAFSTATRWRWQASWSVSIRPFFTAENITDLSNLDGTVHLVTSMCSGGWSTSGAFWNGTPGACLDVNGGAVKFVGSKPVNGDPCGTSLSIKECFPDGAALTTLIDDPQNMDLFYTVYKAGSSNVTTSMRLFGWELRYDPAYATEAGGPCGTCTDPIYWYNVEARPGSFAGNPTTPLHTATGTSATNGNFAYYNNVAGGCPVCGSRSHVGAAQVALSVEM
jgi:hypothetical protein